MKIDTVEKLFEDELRDLYDAEKQLVRALPKMAKAASSDELREGFTEHLEVTKNQVSRLEQIFGLLEVKPKGKPCEAMKGLVAEGQEAIDADAEEPLQDIMLIGAAKRIEHYEMGGYQTAIALAEAIGNEEAGNLLRETLAEEEDTDSKLDDLCQQLLENFGDSEDEEEDIDDLDDDEEDLEEEEEVEEEEEPVAVAPAKKAPARKR